MCGVLLSSFALSLSALAPPAADARAKSTTTRPAPATTTRPSAKQRPPQSCSSTVYTKRAKRKLMRRGWKQIRPGVLRSPRKVKKRWRYVCVRIGASAGTTKRLQRELGTPQSSQVIGGAVTMPSTLNGLLRIDVPHVANVGWRMLDAPKASGRMYSSGAIYTTDQFDVVQKVHVGSIKESIVVHERQGSRTWSWNLWNEEGAQPQLDDDGSVAFPRSDVTIQAPFITNRAGRKIRDLEWKLEGTTLSVTFNDASLPLPYVLDPSADYPAYLYVDSASSGVLNNALRLQTTHTAVTGVADSFTEAAMANVSGFTGEAVFWSGRCKGTSSPACPMGNRNPYNADMALGNADAPYGGPPVPGGGGAAQNVGAAGWVHPVPGGTTLPAGPWTINVPLSWNGNAPGTQAGVRFRVLAVKLNGGAITSWRSMTDWSPVGITGNMNGAAPRLVSSQVMPASRSLTPSEHLYLEISSFANAPATAGAATQLWIKNVASAGDTGTTWLYFGNTGNTNTPPPAPTALSVVGAVGGITTSGTPTFRSNLRDPDSLQHLRFELRTTNSCTSGAATQTGTSPAGREFGEGPPNNEWTPGAALADGNYWVCVRTVEETPPPGAMSGWFGPVAFTVDTTPPGIPANVNDGAGPGDIEYVNSITTLSANWPAATDNLTGIERYRYCITTSATGADCAGGAVRTWTPNSPLTATTMTDSTLSLSEGVRYYTCVSTVDGAGHPSTGHRCSNGQVPDVNPPSQTGPVNDGTGADIAWNTSASSISGNWTAATDPGSGIARYQYCVTTNSGGADCGGGAVIAWTNASPLTSTSFTAAAALTNGQMYYVCTRAWDGAGSSGALRCSDGQRVDTGVPPSPATINDGAGADVDLSNSTTELRANWSSVTDPAPGVGVASGVQRYQYCITTSSSGADCAGAATVAWSDASPLTGTSLHHTGLSLTPDTRYYVCIRTWDVAGNSSSGGCSDGTMVDTTPPGTPGTVNDGAAPPDIQWTNSTSTLAGNWTAASDANGIASYDYCLSTSSSAADCATTAPVLWTDNGAALSRTSMALMLTHGSTYYTCVRAWDNAGNAGAAACSNGVTVDTGAPTNPASVNDGPGADITWNLSTTQVQANWPAGSDAPSGIQRYEYCITTSSSGADCAGAAVVAWTNTTPLTGTSVNRTGLSLTEGQQYFVCVRTWDNAGNGSVGSVCSDGQRVDTVAPPSPTTVNDGPGADISLTSSPNTIEANWTAVTDPAPGVGVASGLNRYQYCITTTNGGSNCATTAMVTWTDNPTPTATSVTRSGLTLVNNETYYVCVRSFDNATNMSATIRCSDGVMADLGPPTAPSFANDGPAADQTWTNSATTLVSNWGTAIDASGINRYEYCLTTSATGADCSGAPLKGWTSTGLTQDQTSTGLALTHAQTYYTCVRAWDNAGNPGPLTCSNGITVDTTLPTNPASVNDGPAADITWNLTTTTVEANWPTGSDALSGLQRYEYCISTSSSGADCTGAATVAWTNTSPLTGTSLNRTGLTLTEGQQYFVCIRTWDNAGNVAGSSICSNGQRVDTVAPPAPATVNDGPGADITLTNSPNTIEANWTPVTDPAPGVGVASGLNRYQYCITTTAGGSNCGSTAMVTWTDNPTPTSTSLSRSGLTLVNNTTYYVCIRSFDNATNMSAAISCSNGVTADLLPPSAPPFVNDGAGADITWSNDASAITSNWGASTDASGINRYEYCISTSSSGTDCATTATKGWTNNGTTLNQVSPLALTHGTTYHTCVRAYDNSGNQGNQTCSNGVTIDTVLPSNPASVSDGPAADITWNLTTTQVQANWPAGADALSGLQRYQYCISTSSSGADCAGAATVAWTNTTPLTGTSINHGSLSLTEGQQYFVCVRTWDNAGNVTASSVCSNGQRVDTVAPPAPTTVNDGSGPDIDLDNSPDTIRANWTAVADPAPGVGVASGLNRYQYCITTTSGGSNCATTAMVTWTDNPTPTATSVTRNGLTLANNTTYYVCIRSFDNATNMSGTISCSNGVTADLQPPTTPSFVNDGTGADIAWSNDGGSLSANWGASTDASGINRYEYCISTSSSGADCATTASRTWTSNGTSLTLTTAISLTDTQLYYTCVRAWDNAGSVGGQTCSNGVTIDTTRPVNPATVNDGTGADVDWIGSTTQISGNWTAGSDGGSGLQRYEYCVSTSSSGADCAGAATVPWTAPSPALGTSFTASVTLTDTETYFVCLRTYDVAGNVSAALACSDGQTVDATPPTGTLVLSEGTNPQFQYKVPGLDRIYVSAGNGGSFFVEVTGASAASGIKDVTFPTLAEFTNNPGTVLTTAPYRTEYIWFGASTQPANPLNAVVSNNLDATLSLPFDVIVDDNLPSGGWVTHGDLWQTALTHNISYEVGTDASSGVLSWQLQRGVSALSNGTCAPFVGRTAVGPLSPVRPGAPPTPWSHTDNVASGFCYLWELVVTDNVQNRRTYGANTPTQRIVRVDTTPPDSASIALTAGSNAFVPAGTPDLVYYNPALAGSFSATVTATDNQSGVKEIDFPAIGAAPWSPTSTTTDASSPYTHTYSWTAGALEPAGPLPNRTAVVRNRTDLTRDVGFSVVADSTPPDAGGSIDYTHGYIVAPYSATITLTNGPGDSASGINRRFIERRETAYDVMGGTCTAYPASGAGSWAQIGPVDPIGTAAGATGTWTDTSHAQPTCYQYRYVEVDNVGNRREHDLPTRHVIAVDDIFPPDPFDVIDPTNPALPAITTGAPSPACTADPTYLSNTPTLQWNSTVDNESGLAGYRVYVSGTTTVPASPLATEPAGVTSHTVATALPEGLRYWGVRAYDMLDNTTDSGPTFLRRVRIDSQPPTANLSTPANNAWLASPTPTLTWSASDGNCLARVRVNVNGAAPAPFTAVASGSETSWTVPAALPDGLYTWEIDAIDSANRSTTSVTRTFGIDTNPPQAFDMITPTSGQTVRGFVNVTWNAASDGTGSGIANYQVWVDSGSGFVLRSTVGGATLSATVSSLGVGSHTVRVVAIDNVGHTTNSTTDRLITAYGTIPAPQLVSPANNARINYLPTLSWQWPDDGGPTPTDYDAQVNGGVVGTVPYAAGIMSYGPIPDPGDGTHTWRVVQRDPYTGTVTSTSRTFILDRVDPNNPGPLTRNVTTMSWPSVTDDRSGVDRIEFWLDDGMGPQLRATLGPTATSYNYGALPDGTYQMWTRAYDRAGNSTDSPIATVMNDTVPPTPFTLDAPPAGPALPAITTGVAEPGCVSVPTWQTGTPTFSWSASSDATSGLDRYDVFVNAAPRHGTVAAPTTTYTPATPLSAGAHTWWVVAYDNFGLQRSSTPNPMSVRIDLAPPAVSLTSPVGGTWTNDSTPTLTWTRNDDNCVARAQVYIDGSLVATASGSETTYTVPTALADGNHTWRVDVIDSAGNMTSSATANFNVDTTAPTGITAIGPAPDGGNVGEGMLTFQWSAGSDGAGSGIARYDLWIDTPAPGSWVANGITTTSSGPYAIYNGPRTWRVRVWDNAGNSGTFLFSFTADPVPDFTAPNGFNLLSPADGSSIAGGTPLTWEPSWDFNGISSYRVFIDGALVATLPGNVTSFTPSTGVGSPLCVTNFDPTINIAGCLHSWTYAAPWVVNAHGTYNAGGDSIGFDSFDADRTTRQAVFTAEVPATGADLRFEHHYDNHTTYNPDGSIHSAWDGGQVQVSVNGEPWRSTCVVGAKAKYGTSLKCDYEIMEPDNGYTAVLAAGSGNPLEYRHVFAGASTGMVQSKLRLSQFAGQTVRVRFVHGFDGCHTGLSASALAWCPAGVKAAAWQIDNITLAEPTLSPGLHTWFVRAVDGSPNANVRQSNQTWSFNLT